MERARIHERRRSRVRISLICAVAAEAIIIAFQVLR
jgi:hypothetical protein